MRDRGGRSALHYAALDNDIASARMELAAGADPNLADRGGFRPLHLAAQQGSVEVAGLLLNNAADVDPRNVDGNTPVLVAVFNFRGDGRLIELLRRHGADPHTGNNHGQTPLGLARLIANYPVAELFADLP